jgi:DNA-binding transcriptional ArsR family regulator
VLDKLFTSKTRFRLLLKLFLNPQVSSYLRELASEFKLSPNALKEELDGLSSAGYLDKEKKGRSIYYKANVSHPFFPELSSLVRKHLGLDQLIEQILKHLGDLEAVYVLDDYARGVDSGLIDVLIVGNTSADYVNVLCQAAERKLKRRVRVMAISRDDFSKNKQIFLDRPHFQII